MKKLYLSYVVYNLSDGHDTDNIGIFDDFESAKKGMKLLQKMGHLLFMRNE